LKIKSFLVAVGLTVMGLAATSYISYIIAEEGSKIDDSKTICTSINTIQSICKPLEIPVQFWPRFNEVFSAFAPILIGMPVIIGFLLYYIGAFDEAK